MSRQASAQNRLLAQFPADVYRRIAPDLEPVAIHPGQVVYEVGSRVTHCYFPSQNAMLSLLCTSQDATAVEVGVTGAEGFVGSAALFGGDGSPHLVIGQIPGAAVRIKSAVMRKVFESEPQVRALLLRFAHALLCQISQTALCNRVHNVEERMARWSLVSQDRSDNHHLPLTHEFLARMLGVNRSTVSLTAATMQRAGIIRYQRGKFSILDRERLEEVSCDCYRIVRDQYKKLGII